MLSTHVHTRGGGGKALVLALTAALAVITGLFSLSGVGEAQSDDEQTGRIVARRLDDGRTEFGWQPSGGERVLPRLRYFPAGVDHQRWLSSSPIEVDGEEIGRINVRQSEDGRLEFAFTPTDGERLEPAARYFPTGTRVGRWLRSTEISISAVPAAGFSTVSVGAWHSCAIGAASGEIVCWGANEAVQTDAPAGRFIAVSAGSDHTCGLREDGGIMCWGANEAGQADAPAGRFIAVSVSTSSVGSGRYASGYACGLRETGAIECWGARRADEPAGRFTAVSVSSGHACAIRESGEIACWGSNSNGETDAPAGRFSAVSTGNIHGCAIRADTSAIECWGLNIYGLTDAPAGRFVAVSASAAYYTCAIRESGEIACWGANWSDGANKGTDAPAGRFSAVSAGWNTCAIRENGAIACWGENRFGQTEDIPAP